MKKFKTHLLAFVAGFLATLVFHQGVIGLFYALGIIPVAPFNMAPTNLGIPAVLSLSFWGGVWGVPIWALVRKEKRRKQILKSIIFGAVGPTAVALLIVFPLKGREVQLAFIPFGLLVNGAWGFGVWCLMKLAQKSVKID